MFDLVYVSENSLVGLLYIDSYYCDSPELELTIIHVFTYRNSL
jgi:hypothetical protein